MIFVIFFEKFNFIKKTLFSIHQNWRIVFFHNFQEFAYVQRQYLVQGRGLYIVSIKSYSNPKLLI